MAQAPGSVAPNRIDVHHHIWPPRYVDRMREQMLEIADVDPAPLLTWTPARSVEEMDRHGVATAISSMSVPGVWVGDLLASRSLARICNEFAAEMVSNHPGRFGFFAALPLPDQEGSLAEIAYALDELQADGIGLMTSYGDRWPGDPAFAPVFDELNRRRAVVFIHPNVPGCCTNLVTGIPPPLTEFLFDTTRAITSLLVSGTFARCPDIRFIFCHAGGTMPVLASRINAFFRRHPEFDVRVPNGVLHELTRLHYDIANSANPSSLSALMNLVPMSQILFGSDFPFLPTAVTTSGFDGYGLSSDDMQAINRTNATRLFPRLSG
jgi:predicted TIM-barrel fold metal-dependent hydrolase